MAKSVPIMTTALALGAVVLLQQHAFGAGASEPAPPSSSWVCVTPEAAFSPRDTAEDLVFDGKMWLSNGYYHGNVLTRDLWASTDGATWTQVNAETPYDGYSEMAIFAGKMWAVKGSVWNSTDGVTWTQVAAHTPFGVRGYGELVVHDGKMWQLGSGEDVWNSTHGVAWTCVTEHAAYGARSAAAVVVFGGKIWLMGGNANKPKVPPEKHYAQYTTYNDVWCSENGTDWECVLEHAPWSPRMWFISKAYAGAMWVIGGFDNVHGKNLGDVWRTKDGKDWREFAAQTTFSPRHEPTCYVYDGSLWVVAGNTWPVVNDVWRLTLPEAK